MFNPDDVWRILGFAISFMQTTPLWPVILLGFAFTLLGCVVVLVRAMRSGGND